MKRIIKAFFSAIGTVLLIIVSLNFWVVQSTNSSIYRDIEEVPSYDVALVLGTSKYVLGGGVNNYWQNRLEAVFRLYNVGKIRHIIVSGDNETIYYNEPKTMKNELVNMGIPAEDITMDYAGLRTLDSIIRCKEVFDQNSFIIVTQQFHNHRAVFIGKYYGLDVVGFAAMDVQSSNRLLILSREYLARTLAVFDLYIMNTSPKFLGAKEPLQID
ncbi:MAG: YdcF family protein [Bacteroidetes bacterium]|nr:YdcF family protein [Bacteroidota bacterium]MDA1120747.1 YdcF family protein [Bacteroidota bacterium]